MTGLWEPSLTLPMEGCYCSSMWRRVYAGREYVRWREPGNRKVHEQLAHRWEWEQAHGPIPEGMEIHHKDHDQLNNDLRNLRLVTEEWHDNYHQRLRENHRIKNGVEQRKCQRCKRWKPLHLFYVRKAGTYGGYCKLCSRRYLAEWHDRNREHVNSYARERRRRGS